MRQNAVIPPPPPSELRAAMRTVRVVVDSRTRDVAKWPTPALYEVDLDEDLLQVMSAELLTASVPLSAPVVSASACALSLRDANDVESTVRVRPGDYDLTALAGAIEDALVAGVSGQAWQVTPDVIGGGFEFRSDAPFVLLGSGGGTPEGQYRAGSIARTLGLDRKEHASTVDSHPTLSNVVRSPFRADLEQHMYAVLHLHHACLNRSAYPLLNKSFAVLAGNSEAASYNYVSPANRIKKSLKPAVARIARLRVHFRGRDGALYDFRNREHVLEFAFEVPCNLTRYNV